MSTSVSGDPTTAVTYGYRPQQFVHTGDISSVRTSRRYFAVIFVVLVTFHCMPFGEALPVTTRTILAPFTKCGSAECDLRRFYCDTIINTCARCDDDCHPSRIEGIPSAVKECQQKCQWYYVFTSTVPPSTKLPVQSSPFAESVVQQRFYEQGSQNQVMVNYVGLILLIIVLLCVVVSLTLQVVRHCQHRSGVSRSGSVVVKDLNQHGRDVDDTRLLTGSKANAIPARRVSTEVSTPEASAVTIMNATRVDEDQRSNLPPTSNVTASSSSRDSSMVPLLPNNARES